MSLTTVLKKMRTRAIVTMIETYPIAVIRDRSVGFTLGRPGLDRKRVVSKVL